MSVFPCGCSICRSNERSALGGGAVMSVGVCEEHQKGPSVELALLAGVVEARARSSGLPMIVDTVKMGDDFVDFIRSRNDALEEGEAVDGSA